MNPSSPRHPVLLRLALGLLFGAATAQAQILVQHQGATDPVGSEGWILAESGFGATAGPIDDSGTPAWFTDDNSTADGSIAIYEYHLTNDQLAEAQNGGWRVAARLRVVEGPANGQGSTFFGFSHESTGFLVLLGRQADGDPVLYPFQSGFSGPSYALEGAGSGYHTFSLVYDATAGSADLFADGLELASDYSGYPITGGGYVSWGAASGGLTGQGNFNLVEFSVVPELGATPVACAVALLAFGAWHRTRSRRS